MSRPDEGLIHQWLDGECTPEESARIERLVATDAEWAAAAAEARGLIAASARIVGALDAVPRAMPEGTRAAPRASGASLPTAVTRNRARRMPAWIGLAATLAIAAGTAYVLREESTAPFGVVTTPAPSSAGDLDTAPGVQVARDARQLTPPADVPPVGSAVPAVGSGRASPSAAAVATPGAGVSSPQATLDAPPPSPPAARPADAVAATAAEQRKLADATRRAEELTAEQERARASESPRVMRATDAPRGAIARAAEPTMATAGSSATLTRLAGCWRVTAPPEFVGVLESPEIRRAAGDTLVLVTARGDVTVTRAGDVLRGGLQATLETCRVPE